MTIDLPLPVSPVKTLSPGPRSTVVRSMRPKPSTVSVRREPSVRRTTNAPVLVADRSFDRRSPVELALEDAEEMAVIEAHEVRGVWRARDLDRRTRLEV